MSRIHWPATVGAILLGTALGIAQTTNPRTSEASQSIATQPAAELIELSFPDNVELKVLIQYVSERLGINFIYDDQAVAQRITIQSPVEVPKESLMGILESSLRMKGLVIVDSEARGWKKIVPATNLLGIAAPATQTSNPAAGPTSIVTQIFTLAYSDPNKADQVVRPFLSQPGGNSIPLPDQHLLIVTDYAPTVAKIADLVRLIDQPPPLSETFFLPLINVDVSAVSSQVTQILTAKARAQTSAGAAQPLQVEVLTEPRTNQLILIGPSEKVHDAAQIARSLDVALPLETHVYSFKSISSDRIDKLAREFFDPLDVKRLYQSAVDKDANLLVVTTTAAMQAKIEKLKEDLDVTQSSDQSPIRFYKLTNTTAADVLATIRSIEGDQESSGPGGANPTGVLPSSATGTSSAPGALSGITGPGALPGAAQTPSMNLPPSAPGQTPPVPPAYNSGSTSQNPPGATGSQSGGVLPSASNPQTGAAGAASNSSGIQPGAIPPIVQALHTAKATVTADPNTNSIIVVADPVTQHAYAQLIKSLDKRRPQVLIEVTLVTLDSSQDLNLGVELGGRTKGKTQGIGFSSFGLSTVTASTGQLAIIPGAGFNGTILSSDVASVVVQALSTDTHAKVLSAPRILVNDNATGTLDSIAESPFESVNASNTVSTTSFAGYASAGTTISVTPHISEGEYLQLEYTVALNNFTGQATSTLPPPRQTDSVQSKVTVPDGSTVIVGGLKRLDSSVTKEGVPLLSDIPVLGLLFSSNTFANDNSTLFVFIRPLILRDDEFGDLKYLSERDMKAAEMPSDYPASEPLIIE